MAVNLRYRGAGMRIIQNREKKSKPSVVTAVDFTPWPFKENVIPLNDKGGFIGVFGNHHHPRSDRQWYLTRSEPVLVTLSDGTHAATNVEGLAAYDR